jgi:hypothetical protein
MSSKSYTALREEAIREKARYIWEQMGHPTGHDLDIWLRAEAEVRYELPRSYAEVIRDEVESKNLSGSAVVH